MRRLALLMSAASLVVMLIPGTVSASGLDITCDKQGDTVATKYPNGTDYVRYYFYGNSGYVGYRVGYRYSGFRVDTMGGATYVRAYAGTYQGGNGPDDTYSRCR